MAGAEREGKGVLYRNAGFACFGASEIDFLQGNCKRICPKSRRKMCVIVVANHKTAINVTFI